MTDKRETCTHCGTPLEEKDTFCHCCGRRRDGKTPESAMPFWMREPDEPAPELPSRTTEEVPMEEKEAQEEPNSTLNRVLICVIAGLLLLAAGVFSFLLIRSSVRGETLGETVKSLFAVGEESAVTTPIPMLPVETATAEPDETPMAATESPQYTPIPMESLPTKPPLTSLCEGTYMLVSPEGDLALTVLVPEEGFKDGIGLAVCDVQGDSSQSFGLDFRVQHDFVLRSALTTGERVVEINRGYSSTLYAGVPVEVWTPHLDTDHLFRAVLEDNGCYTIRLAADTGYCLSYDTMVGEDAPVTLQPVTASREGQYWDLQLTSQPTDSYGLLPDGGEDPEAFILQAGFVPITRESLYPYTRQQVEYIRSGIYALAGRQFSNTALQAYFESKAWYSPAADDTAVLAALTEVQKSNIQLIIQYESDLGWR